MTILQWSNALVSNYFGIISLILLTLFLLATLILLVTNRRLRRITKRYRELMADLSGANLEDLICELSRRVDDVTGQTDLAIAQLSSLTARSERSIQSLGLVRFNAFNDTGSDLSFSLALLDARHTGIVITSLYGREETRVYAKPVEEGQSRYTLSIEERQAITVAASADSNKVLA